MKVAENHGAALVHLRAQKLPNLQIKIIGFAGWLNINHLSAVSADAVTSQRPYTLNGTAPKSNLRLSGANDKTIQANAMIYLLPNSVILYICAECVAL